MMRMFCFAIPAMLSFFIPYERTVAGLTFVQESNDSQLQTLQEARRDTLKQLVGLYRAEPGKRTSLSLCRVRFLLAEAELEIVESPGERIKILEELTDDIKAIERETEARSGRGTTTGSELSFVKVASLKSEFILNKARAELQTGSGTESMSGSTIEAANVEILKRQLEILTGARSHFQSTMRPNQSDLFQVEEEILETVVELSRGSKEAVTNLEKLLAEKLKVEAFHQSRKPISERDYLAARADRVKSAIVLQNAKAGSWPRSSKAGVPNDPLHPADSTDPEMKVLLVEYRDTLKTLRQRVLEDRVNGRAQSEDVIKINNACFGAELALAASPQESVEFLEDALKIQSDFEKELEVRLRVGVLPLSEFVLAKSERMRVEIELLKARNRIAARNTEPASAVNQSVPLCAHPSMHRDSHRPSCDFRQKSLVGRIRKSSARCIARCRATRKSASIPRCSVR